MGLTASNTCCQVCGAALVKNFSKGYDASLLGCGAERCRLSFKDPARPALAWNITVSASTWALEEASFEDDEMKMTLKCFGYRVNRGLSASSLRLELPSDVEMYEGLPKFFKNTLKRKNLKWYAC